jgi:hypothetical protein
MCTHAHTHTHTHTHTLQISYPSYGRTQYLQAVSHCLSSNDRFPLSHCKQDTIVRTLCTLQWKVLWPRWTEEFLVSVQPHTTTAHKGWSNRTLHTQYRKQSGIRTHKNIRATKFEYAAHFIHQKATIKIPNTDVQYLGLVRSLFQNFCKHFPSQRVRIVLL